MTTNVSIEPVPAKVIIETTKNVAQMVLALIGESEWNKEAGELYAALCKAFPGKRKYKITSCINHPRIELNSKTYL